MSDLPNTLFLRLEGPLQAWGDTSKFVIRRTMEAPTKSGILGLLCCAEGRTRAEARKRLTELNKLVMGVRVDRPGIRWWDYDTAGAGIGMTTAGGGVKTGAQGTLIMRREYLADASFLVTLHGESSLINELANALADPKWLLFLGRKCCSPSAPIFTQPRAGESWMNPAHCPDLLAALANLPWYPREEDERREERELPCLIEWRPRNDTDYAPSDAAVWYDVPKSFSPPYHEARFVISEKIVAKAGYPLHDHTPPPHRPRANYRSTQYQNARDRRWETDHDVCVFCKVSLTKRNRTVQHITYRRAGGNEAQEDLRSLCRLCHDAVTMIEYGLGMGLDRINPEDPGYRERIILKRKEIIAFRSLETRRRRLSAEEVE
jgi:CRISPR system Cascade subunit CasD